MGWGGVVGSEPAALLPQSSPPPGALTACPASRSAPQLFSARSEAFASVCSTLQLLFTALRGSLSWPRCLPPPAGLSPLFFASYVLLELWVALRLLATVLVHHYRQARSELYRPAFEPQDYEMVELFVRRLRMWMGFSKAKEVRAGAGRGQTPGSPL